MKEAAQKMQDEQRSQQHTATQQPTAEATKKPTTTINDEYIDFEEVK